jgi:hypothetical protein
MLEVYHASPTCEVEQMPSMHEVQLVAETVDEPVGVGQAGGILDVMASISGLQADGPADSEPRDVEGKSPLTVEWIGRLGDPEPDPYAAMTPAERIEMVWPLTLAAWAFSGKASDESRLRRDVESVIRRSR